MNKGFLMFSQDEGLTSECQSDYTRLVLKDEPEDLTHLAPTAGDACIPLENSPFDMFDDFILGDNYCSLLGDDLGSGSPVDSLTPDPLLLSSPEPNENDSSCEQSSLLTELSLDAFDNTRSDNDIDDENSPFIPTSDELPLLEPAVMWGALPDSVSMARPQPPEPQASPAPALQRLLTASTTGPPPQDLITNIYSDSGLIPSRTVSTWDTGVKRVLKQETAIPCAKRARRSPSPVPQKTSNTPSSSVLMNLLDIPQPHLQQQSQQLRVPSRQMVGYPQQRTQQTAPNKTTIPLVHMIPTEPRDMMPTNTPLQQVMRTNMASPMSPLSLSIGSPMYSLPSSPNSYSSPAMSPAQRDRVMSPYSPYTPQMSPIGKFHQVYSPGSRLLSPAGVIQGSDPYLTTKMQPSPNYIQNELIEPNVQLTSTDFWPDADLLQGTNDLLIAFDDVKL